MPSISRSNTMPTIIHAEPAASKKARVVGFKTDPVLSVSRPLTNEESWALYRFEMHARNCVYCNNAYEVHRHHEQLCEVGHRLAQGVAMYLYNKDSKPYSTEQEDNKLVQVEVPASYPEVTSLLKAIERSLRHRSRRPFVSMDRSYYVAPRVLTPQRTRSVKLEHEPRTKTRPSRPRSGEVVEWAENKHRAVAQINNTSSPKRGSLYEEDIAKQRRNAKHYSVEVREPSQRDLREHRLSGYYS